MKIYEKLNLLIKYALKNQLIGEYDEVVAQNDLMDILELEEWYRVDVDEELIPEYPYGILNEICDYAVEKGIIEDSIVLRDLLDTKIMGKLTPKATQVIEKFQEIKNNSGINLATDYFYELSQKTNYIRRDRIEKNINWLSSTEYGDMEITINLSKPEKDPKDIERERNLPQSSYPKCLLCYENVGYKGRLNAPARQNHRVLPVELGREKWCIQYSPYVYYNEHMIVFSKEHRPMKITKSSFDRLTEFTEKFPHYFVGSNADLPIVGGSILTHDHYQGGNYSFPMEKAPVEEKIKFRGFENIEAGIVKWPMSVIRLKGKNRKDIVELGDKILKNWINYSDEELEILAYTGEVRHNTITPIARRNGEEFELDLVLRNNRTTDKYPMGIFHPHEEVHNIKKENIGLIEVMGLAVLPGRLKSELEILEDYLCDDDYEKLITNDDRVVKHLDWCKEIKSKNKNISSQNIKNILQFEVGNTFSKVLEYAGVYKRDEKGKKGFLRFIEYVNEN